MFQSNGYSIFRVEPTPSHGGSIRVWSCRNGEKPIEDSVQEYLNLEIESKILEKNTLENFANEVKIWRTKFRKLITELQLEGAVIGGLGAPSRASTLIAFAGLTEMDLVGVGEIPTSSKIGKNMPGTRIPVVEESKLLDKKPTHLLILSWHIQDSIIGAIRKKGFTGKFIVPMPHPVVVEAK
jgi:hypothetical protein